MSTPSSPVSAMPDKASLDGLEERWSAVWADERTYEFDRSAARDQVYSVDTPPPTASGSLHVGHVFSYTHTDAVARYQRMTGKSVFYPMGWDDNGLPTERRVQNYYGVSCDPSLAYDASFAPPFRGDVPDKHQAVAVSRPNFVKLCTELTAQDEKSFETLFRRLGLSVDWNHQYQTIGADAQRVSQRAFLRNLARGEAYSLESPTLWDVDFCTAVAQAELEDRERPAAYHQIAFHRVDCAGDVVIDTTRPELLAACVALVAHPDDERYQPLFGKTVRTPLYEVEVPVRPHPLAQPDKGTGIAMCCTFGDLTDVTWWRELELPARTIVGRDGRMRTDVPEWIASAEGTRAYEVSAGLWVKQAQAKVVEQLRTTGELIGEPRPIVHPVKFYERGERPLEIVSSRQWYIRNGGRDSELREALLGRGEELTWYPEHMQHRYSNWVEGLNGDWLISRQRFFGVPLPLWYPLDSDGQPDFDSPLVPSEDRLPIDPSADIPVGYNADQRGRPDGFIGESDVMDTWATSSMTPQIAGGWETDTDLFGRVFPMDVRPQGHDIIRTWLFASVVRAHHEHQSLPWRNTTLSGWILDPDRKKMSKSKGNVVTPIGLLDTYGTDAVRYWATSARPGVDTAMSEEQMKVGRKLAIKLLNASKFVLGITGGSVGSPEMVSAPIDRAQLARLAVLIGDATAAFEVFDYARALERSEAFFWEFCDDYVELVKGRAYGSLGADVAPSAQATLSLTLSAVQRLLAPFLPYATEEVWRWWHDNSVHRAAWPTVAELGTALDGADLGVHALAVEVLGAVRRAKTEAKKGMRWPVSAVVVSCAAADAALLDAARADLCESGAIASLTFVEGADRTVSVTLADAPATD